MGIVSSHLPLLAVAVPLAAAILVPLWTYLSPRLAERWTQFFTLVTLLLCGALFWKVHQQGPLAYTLGGWAPPWGIEYRVDALSVYFAIFLSGASFLSSVYASSYNRQWRPAARGAFAALLLLLTAGLLGMVLTADLFNLFVFMEISALSAYGVLSSGGDRAVIATYRYLLVGTVGATFYLLGVGFLYAQTGTLNLVDLASWLPQISATPMTALAAAFLIIGLAAKAAIFPFHAWLPDVYAYAPTPASAFISAVMTKVAAYAMIRLSLSLFSGYAVFQEGLNLLLFASAAGMVAGSLFALSQRDIRRMLGYSSVGQIAAVVFGICLNTPSALVGALFHVLSHAAMKQGLFFAVGGVLARSNIKDIPDYRGFSREYPKTSAAFFFLAASMAGLPPTAGFFGKWYLIQGCFEAGKTYLAAAVVLSALCTAAYFFQVVELGFFQKEGRPKPVPKPELPWSQMAPVLFLSGLVVIFGVWNRPIVEKAVLPALQQAAQMTRGEVFHYGP